jgi:hypothetical protein
MRLLHSPLASLLQKFGWSHTGFMPRSLQASIMRSLYLPYCTYQCTGTTGTGYWWHCTGPAQICVKNAERTDLLFTLAISNWYIRSGTLLLAPKNAPNLASFCAKYVLCPRYTAFESDLQ